MIYVILWLLFGFVGALAAQSKERSGLGWFLIGLLFGPFVFLVFLLPSKTEQQVKDAQLTGAAGEYRKCPMCAEVVRKEAIKCRYCGSELTADDLRSSSHVSGSTLGSTARHFMFVYCCKQLDASTAKAGSWITRSACGKNVLVPRGNS